MFCALATHTAQSSCRRYINNAAYSSLSSPASISAHSRMVLAQITFFVLHSFWLQAHLRRDSAGKSDMAPKMAAKPLVNSQEDEPEEVGAAGILCVLSAGAPEELPVALAARVHAEAPDCVTCRTSMSLALATIRAESFQSQVQRVLHRLSFHHEQT